MLASSALKMKRNKEWVRYELVDIEQKKKRPGITGQSTKANGDDKRMSRRRKKFMSDDVSFIVPQRIRSDQLYSGSMVSWTEEESKAELKRRKKLGRQQL